jgi:SAM-dependent methyltransferase
MKDLKQYFDANKKLWNKRTLIHKDSAFYDVAGFKKGKTSLKDIELNEVGDVKNKKLLHLQCHFGMDTLSWARLGAEVTGIDISDEAIKTAKALSKETGLKGEFFCCNIYDLLPGKNAAKSSSILKNSKAGFDIIFTSYGVIGWLPELNKWAEIISYYLKPGGTFYIAEFHPVVWMFDEYFEEIKYYYHNHELITVESEGTYTDRYADIKGTEFSWNHSISEVLNSLINHGLKIELFNEYSYSPFNCFNHLVQGPDGNYRIKGREDKIPMVYSVRATKQ